MPALPYVYLVARAAEIILNARDNTTIASIYMDPTNDTEIANGTGTLLFNDSSRVSIAPNMNRPNFNLPGSQQGSMLNMSSPIQIVNQETMYIFAAYIMMQVIVNLTLSVLFAGAIIRHVLETDAESWTPHAQLLYVLRCDVRGAFIDTVAQVVKLVLNLCAGGNTVVFGSHVCDFVKIACAHWFVGDVVLSIGGGKNAASGGIGPSGGGGGGSRGTGHTAGAAVNVQQVSARRKGSFGTRTSQYFKDTDKSGGYTGSLDTLKAISAEKLNVRQPPPLSPAGSARMLTAADSVRGRSIESLRATSSPLGEAALRSARSSDHVNMFSRK
ncbi:hypothetical protein HDU82_005337 [Entophlyctis luteolus]|nr:hypothetical protein HDU82_005337 [Entophlyctis luteolus]